MFAQPTVHCTQLQHCGNAGASNEILTIKCISRFNCCFANVNAAGICSPGQERRQHLLPYAVAVVVVAGAAAATASGLLIAADQVEAEAAIDFQHTFTLHAKGASSNRNSLRCVRVYTVCVCVRWMCGCEYAHGSVLILNY